MTQVLKDDIRNNQEDLTQGMLELLLHRNTATRGLESCWMEGYYYAETGHEESKNPFQHDTIEHKYYSEGWWAGFYNEDPLFPEYSFNHKALNPINDADINLLDTDNILAAEPNNESLPLSPDPDIEPEKENPKVSSGFLKRGSVLAGLGVAASVIAVFSVTLLDAA